IGTIQLAHQRGLMVMLKPHLWIAHGIYTGGFALDSDKEWELWEASHRDYILHFAAIADSMKAEILCIGTELGATTKARPAYWSSLIDSIKKIYRGKLTYAANWDDYTSVPFWKKLDYIGVDAYFPLATDKTPAVNSIKKGWQKHINQLEKLSTQYGRPVLFTEYGYRNVDNTTAEPWKENKGDENNDAQANAFEGFYQSFARKKWFAGGFVWKWYIDDGRYRRDNIDFSPQGKQAEKVIENWYSDK
ncbi:MAG: glycoside hydrolase family 113, partial [Segetibacter sp.]